MNINCPEIDLVIKLAEDSGNKVTDVSFAWSAVDKVFYMTEPLTNNFKEKIQLEISALEYWRCEDSHYALEDGFTCKEHRASIAFPILSIGNE